MDPDTSEPEAGGRRRQVLVIDDEPLVLRVACLMVHRLGHTAHGAAGSQEGLSLLREKRDEIDLIIMDMLMPGLSGGRLVEEIISIKPDAQVVLASGAAQPERIVERYAAVRGWLMKPFRMEDLRRLVEESGPGHADQD